MNPKRGFENGQRPFRQSPKRLCPKGVEARRPESIPPSPQMKKASSIQEAFSVIEL
ncbi:hypothetical protein [Chlorobium phaeovibrioides]|uniref:hypothetical protein n=1 Tax=Chlorobium phaeovibrioides TaxID=1094 RepID=UPI00163B5092|nr:hypothetical protein [Chlorobium phaeovibrioides]